MGQPVPRVGANWAPGTVLDSALTANRVEMADGIQRNAEGASSSQAAG
jgi:hypothetical protein